jgi:hypothetical protein
MAALRRIRIRAEILSGERLSRETDQYRTGFQHKIKKSGP